ncbi:hypothetical protein MKW92_053439 [Papaver armeniacum]|nr:hypothetical protein MKW92_053439 [Papaver armeniacum]
MATTSETSAAYLRVIKRYETRDDNRRKFLEKQQLKNLEEENSNQNAEVGANVRDQDDGGRIDDSKQTKGITSEDLQMRLLEFELSRRAGLGPTEVAADGIPKYYMSPEPWFNEAPNATMDMIW